MSNDEERSEMRYVVRIAEFSESSNFERKWHFQLPAGSTLPPVAPPPPSGAPRAPGCGCCSALLSASLGVGATVVHVMGSYSVCVIAQPMC